jgi:hypothetical protein
VGRVLLDVRLARAARSRVDRLVVEEAEPTMRALKACWMFTNIRFTFSSEKRIGFGGLLEAVGVAHADKGALGVVVLARDLGVGRRLVGKAVAVAVLPADPHARGQLGADL